MNGPSAVGAVEDEPAEFAFEAGLHPEEVEPQQLRAEGESVGPRRDGFVHDPARRGDLLRHRAESAFERHPFPVLNHA
jgi:hypothetical protein